MKPSWIVNFEKNEAEMEAINYFINDCINQSLTDHDKDLARYLNELFVDLQELNEIEAEYPGLLLHVHALLIAEINRVWNLLHEKQFDSFENEWQSQILEETKITLQEKIALSREQIVDYVRKAKNFHSAPLKSLEKETDCEILIRGKGSLLDHRRESRLKNYPGWEHLSESLYLLVRANDETITRCTMKLANDVRRVKQCEWVDR
uniref:Uncharacterized protein n=1 Tax=Onchocerca volvulus TaxID=6282 RepID=A0A8R1TIL1_ONCVO